MFSVLASLVLTPSTTAQEAPKIAPRRPKMPPRGRQDGPRGPLDGPRSAQDSPREPQEGPKGIPKRPQERVVGHYLGVLGSHHAPQDPPGRLQDAAKRPPQAPERPPERPPRGPAEASKRAQPCAAACRAERGHLFTYCAPRGSADVSLAVRSPPGRARFHSDPRRTSRHWATQKPTRVATVSQFAAPMDGEASFRSAYDVTPLAPPAPTESGDTLAARSPPGTARLHSGLRMNAATVSQFAAPKGGQASF